MRRSVYLFLLMPLALIAQMSIVPTDSTQSDITGTYLFGIDAAQNYWTTYGTLNPDVVAGEFGEVPILWVTDGNLLYPDTLVGRGFTNSFSGSFDLATVAKSYSILLASDQIAVFRSSVLDFAGQNVTWEFPYFRGLLTSGFGIKEEDLVIFSDTMGAIPSGVKLLVIPAFEMGGIGTDFLEQDATDHPELGAELAAFLSGGGTIYTEGNAAYLLELFGIVPSGTVDPTDVIDGVPPDMIASYSVADPDEPLGFPNGAAGLYTVSAPTLSAAGRTILTYSSTLNPADVGKPAAIELDTMGGRIIMMASTPAANVFQSGSGQWQVVANAMLTPFCHKLSLSRSVYTGFVSDSVDLAPYSLPVGDSLSFTITVKIRNLWNAPVSEATLTEYKNSLFDYVDVVSGPTPSVAGNSITFDIPTLAPGETYTIQYRLRTPAEGDSRWASINSYVWGAGYSWVSSGTLTLTDPITGLTDSQKRTQLYVRFLFEADIIADTDLNWKNILGEYFQPFKIFMIMENKGKTAAYNTRYVQYIPLDVPIYWVAPEAIPIIRTPGGEFVDILRGSEDIGTVEHDMDGDGDPDAWLNQATFQRTPDSLTLELIYWKNPWSGLYEDIDKDGIRPRDDDGDGVFEVEDPGDKIRAYRAVWNIAEVPGYQYYDPYTSWELWIDPPPLVEMAIGASYHDGLGYTGSDTGYYYPDWRRWMEKDSLGNVTMARLVRQHIDSYEGFAFKDTDYVPSPYEDDLGIVPKPRREYIAVLNLGGHEPTMTSPTPDTSDYANIYYQTVWGKPKITPIRTTYTYYAPLPNPLQFEYISCTFDIRDPGTGAALDYLPAYNDADIAFHITASTEYSYYWIANVGDDYGTYEMVGDHWTRVSDTPDGIGDGVFGYLIQEIPKGLGSYSISLARNPDSTFDVSSIVPDFEPFLFGHDSVATAVQVINYPFYYSVYIPQILIPPALDDNNHDGADDWLDDFGDRFKSSTGYLHDFFPPGDGEDAESLFAIAPWDTTVPIEGDLAHAHSGWSPGVDGTYGDDLVDKLGQYKIDVHAKFHGNGREGPIEINRGVWLVNEEIFGGSPWVQFSHGQSAYAMGNRITLGWGVNPTLVSLYPDTVIMRWRVRDPDEPHTFDDDFDPFRWSYADDDVAITVLVGGKEPTGLFSPEYVSAARVDPTGYDDATITAIPDADTIAALIGTPWEHPVTETGSFLQIVVEVDNNSDADWYNLTLRPDLSGLGASEGFLWYGCYPRPLVPAHIEGDTIVPGDDPTNFRAGWRFNSSALEVLNRPGNADGSAMIPQVMVSRRAYFIFHIKLDPNLPIGIYDMPIALSGEARAYDATSGTPLTYSVPAAKFAVVRKDASGRTTDPPQFVIGQATMGQLHTELMDYTTVPSPASDVRWFTSAPTPSTFDSGTPVSASLTGNDLYASSPYTLLPSDADHTDYWLGARAIVDAPTGSDRLYLDNAASQSYTDLFGLARTAGTGRVWVESRGSKMMLYKRVARVNGEDIPPGGEYELVQGQNEVVLALQCADEGNDIARDLTLYAYIGAQATFASGGTDYTYTYDDTEKLLTYDHPFQLYPGDSREIPVTIYVDRVEGYEVIDMMYAFIADFSDAESDGALHREIHPDTIRYSADLVLDDAHLTAWPAQPAVGQETQINAEVHFHGSMAVKNAVVRFFENDTQIGEDQIITVLSSSESTATVSVPFTPSSYYHRIFATVDPDSQIGESNENNNTAKLELIVNTGEPLTQVLAYPNPFKDYTEFTYVLTRPMEKVSVGVFTLRGREVKRINNGPAGAGYNYVSWDGTDKNGNQIGNGTYIYKLIAKDGDGNHEYQERIVRMR